jgi:hypothetical protein
MCPWAQPDNYKTECFPSFIPPLMLCPPRFKSGVILSGLISKGIAPRLLYIVPFDVNCEPVVIYFCLRRIKNYELFNYTKFAKAKLNPELLN